MRNTRSNSTADHDARGADIDASTLRDVSVVIERA